VGSVVPTLKIVVNSYQFKQAFDLCTSHRAGVAPAVPGGDAAGALPLCFCRAIPKSLRSLRTIQR